MPYFFNLNKKNVKKETTPILNSLKTIFYCSLLPTITLKNLKIFMKNEKITASENPNTRNNHFVIEYHIT